MSEQPTREEIEEALNGDERKLEDWDTLSWAARQYLASLDVPAPSDCHVYKNIYGFWCFACSFKTEQDADAMLAKYASAPSDAVTVGGHHSESGSPKDGTRGPHKLEENARLKARIEQWEKTADHHWSARQKLQRELNVVTELYNAGRGAEARVNEHEVVLNSYAEENQRLFDRAERAEARVKELEGENAKQREVSNFHFVGQAAAEARVKELELRVQCDQRVIDNLRHALAQSEKEPLP